MLAFFVFAATAVQAAPVDVYRGPLGGAEVVLELRKPDAGPDDVAMTEGEWATSSVSDFAIALRKYIGYGSGSPSHDGSDADGGNE